MSDERANLRHHVRAAREWLGRAEVSLDREEDIKSDLNLMLAQAELSRAKETEHPAARLRIAREFLPAAAALLIFFCGWLILRPDPSASVSSPETDAPTVTAAAALAAKPSKSDPPPTKTAQADLKEEHRFEYTGKNSKPPVSNTPDEIKMYPLPAAKPETKFLTEESAGESERAKIIPPDSPAPYIAPSAPKAPEKPDSPSVYAPSPPVVPASSERLEIRTGVPDVEMQKLMKSAGQKLRER